MISSWWQPTRSLKTKKAELYHLSTIGIRSAIHTQAIPCLAVYARPTIVHSSPRIAVQSWSMFWSSLLGIIPNKALSPALGNWEVPASSCVHTHTLQQQQLDVCYVENRQHALLFISLIINYGFYYIIIICLLLCYVLDRRRQYEEVVRRRVLLLLSYYY